MGGRGEGGVYFYLEEVFRRTVDLLEGLLAGFRDGLHFQCLPLLRFGFKWVGGGLVVGDKWERKSVMDAGKLGVRCFPRWLLPGISWECVVNPCVADGSQN